MIRKLAASKLGASIGLLCGWLVAVACSSEDEDPSPSSNGGTSSGGTTGGSSTAGTSGGGTKNSGGSTSSGGTKNSGGSTSSGGDGGAPGGEGGSGDTGSGGDAGDTGSGGEGGENAGLGGAGGEGGQGSDPVAVNLLVNPSFEDGLLGWTNDGTDGAAFVENGGHSGSKRLTHWIEWVNPDPGYEVSTFQIVTGLENGTYSFSIWVDRDWFDEQYLFATGFNEEDPDEIITVDTSDDGNGYFKFTVSGIEVTSGSCKVGVYSSAPGGTWASFDDAEFVREE
jgi:hypothetical protein